MALSIFYADQMILDANFGFITGFIPYDFSTLKSCVLRFNPAATVDPFGLEVAIDVAAAGETYNNVTVAPVASALAVVQNQIFEVDITDVLPDTIARNDYFGVRIQTGGGADIYSMGMNLIYRSTNVQNGIVHEIEKFYHAPECFEGEN